MIDGFLCCYYVQKLEKLHLNLYQLLTNQYPQFWRRSGKGNVSCLKSEYHSIVSILVLLSGGFVTLSFGLQKLNAKS